MSLTEPQIQRYGRQILLRPVGGRGQRALLESPVVLRGSSLALEVGAAYLAAGGSPVLGWQGEGKAFLAGGTLADFNPDAVAPADVEPVIALVDAGEEAGELLAGGVRVVLGARGLALLDGGCPACGAAVLERIDGVANPVDAVVLGAAAALLVQRSLLGLEPEREVLLLLGPSGAPERVSSLPRCPAHAR